MSKTRKRQNNVIDIVKDEKNCYTQTAWVGLTQSRKGAWLFYVKRKSSQSKRKTDGEICKERGDKVAASLCGIFASAKATSKQNKG